MAPDLLAMLRDSVTEPQRTAARLLALSIPRPVVIQGALLVSVLDALVLGLLGQGAPLASGPLGDPVGVSPFAHAAILLVSLFLSAAALGLGGRLLGGTGRFEQALLLVVWLEVLSMGVQAATLLAALAVPSLAGLLGLLGLGVLLWCVVHFTRVLHSFEGYGRAVGAVLLGGAIVVVGLSVLLAALGFGGPPDV